MCLAIHLDVIVMHMHYRMSYFGLHAKACMGDSLVVESGKEAYILDHAS